MKKNEIGNNRADSKKSVESKNCDELMTVPCVDTDIKPSSDDEGDYTSEVKFVRVSDLYSNYLKRWLFGTAVSWSCSTWLYKQGNTSLFERVTTLL